MSIVIENLSKSYGPVRALQNVSCTWEPGKLYGLLGRNGAGKTTLFNCLTDELPADYLEFQGKHRYLGYQQPRKQTY